MKRWQRFLRGLCGILLFRTMSEASFTEEAWAAAIWVLAAQYDLFVRRGMEITLGMIDLLFSAPVSMLTRRPFIQPLQWQPHQPPTLRCLGLNITDLMCLDSLESVLRGEVLGTKARWHVHPSASWLRALEGMGSSSCTVRQMQK